MNHHRSHASKGMLAALVVGVVSFGIVAQVEANKITRASEQTQAELRKVNELLAVVRDQTDDWSPLGPYPDQRVLEVRPDEVVIEGTKCIDREEMPPVVEIRGSVTLISVDEPGIFISLFSGQRTVRRDDPDCITRTYHNLLPVDQMRLHPEVGTWRVVGTEVPRSAKGQEGVPAVWRSEEFAWPPTEGTAA